MRMVQAAEAASGQEGERPTFDASFDRDLKSSMISRQNEFSGRTPL